jgi:hypothetical protein
VPEDGGEVSKAVIVAAHAAPAMSRAEDRRCFYHLWLSGRFHLGATSSPLRNRTKEAQYRALVLPQERPDSMGDAANRRVNLELVAMRFEVLKQLDDGHDTSDF